MRVRLTVAALLAAAAIFGTCTPAYGLAEQSASNPESDATTTLPYQLSVSGANGKAEVLVPLPDGSNPIKFDAVVKSTYQTAGQIVITSGQRRAASVSAPAGGRVSFDVLPGDVTNGQVPISMFAQLENVADCFSDDNEHAVLDEATLTYRHPTLPVSTVGTFLSEGISSYQVVIPVNPSQAEQSAGLTAVGSMAHRYSKPTAVSLVATDTPPAPTFLDRQILFSQQPGGVSDGASNGVVNTVRVDAQGRLVITGSADGLQQAAIALASPNTQVLNSPDVTNLVAAPEFLARAGTMTFADLNVPPVSMSGVGRQDTNINLDQPLFGQQIEQFSIRLRGTLTQLPQGAQGRVDFVWNDQLVASREMSASTSVQQDLLIPKELLARQNRLTISLNYVPPGTACAPPGLPARLDINPVTSSVDATLGTSLAPGFDRFPETFAAKVPVALGPGGTTQSLIRQASLLVASLTQGWPQQLEFEVTNVADVIAGNASAMIVGSDDQLTQQLDAPLRIGDSLSLGADMTQFGANPVSPVAYLQAFAQGSRNIVLLGHRDTAVEQQALSEALADQLAAYTYQNPSGWQVYKKQVAVVGPDGQPQELDLRQSVPDKNSIMLIATAIGLAVCLVSLLIFLWLRPRRRKETEPAP